MAVERIIDENKGRKKITFDQKYRRLTTYIERETYHHLQSMREAGELTSITSFFNQCLKEGLKRLEE